MKIGRNDPCYCDSGKKYKKCCIEKTDFARSVLNIKNLYANYSPDTTVRALFAIASWLPNISASVKIALLYRIYLTMKETDFLNKESIESYKELQAFYQILFKYLPEFPSLEDYWPEQDFGEIRFYHNKKIYKVYHGGGYENSYEYLYMFQLIYVPLDDEFIKHYGRSSNNEFVNRLILKISG